MNIFYAYLLSLWVAGIASCFIEKKIAKMKHISDRKKRVNPRAKICALSPFCNALFLINFGKTVGVSVITIAVRTR